MPTPSATPCRPPPYVVSKVDETEKLDKADPPFKTSTLQQQAAIRLRFSGKKTMKVAQELYEGIDVDGSGPVGLITYMRTDSLRVSDEAMTAVRDKIKNEFGERYLPAKPIRYAAGKMAQEAHEAIRPTDLALTPERIKEHLTPRPVPALPAHLRPVRRQPDGPGRLHGHRRGDHGRRRALQGPGQGPEVRRPPPRLAAGAASRKTSCCRPSPPARRSTCTRLDATQHFTQPPPRYSEATLIKALEKEAIGRPSTYAPIIQTIQDRGYVEQKERRFHATDLGMVVTDLLVEQFPKILDLKFTAHMEDELDDIASAKEDMIKVLDEFYYPFQEELQVGRDAHGAGPDPDRARSATSAARRWCSSSARPASSWAARSTPSARRPGRSAASPAPRPSRASTPAPSAASRS